MMTVPLTAALSDPVFDALSVELSETSAADSETAARQALSSACRTVLATDATDWSVRPVHPSKPLAFDFIPPAGHTISVGQGFELQYHLEALDVVDRAEAVFETNLDDIPEAIVAPPDTAPLEALFGGDSTLTDADTDPEWPLNLIEVRQAWALSDPECSQGRGVLIGHPDGGYIAHVELDDERLRHDLERDFYDGDPSAENSFERGGSHGLATGSVIMSGETKLLGNPARFVTGIAPAAQLVPLRITKKGPPVFFSRSGPRQVRDAVYHAVDSGCHIISMSLGGPWLDALHDALRYAYEQNVLLIAAAGNVVRFVIWPARYPEVIAVAACTATRERWFHSSRGASVDITAPGHNIWRAHIWEDNVADVAPSSGTSYATAVTAGVAALWLAHHGREQLLEHYAGIPLNEVFRHMLRSTCGEPPPEHNNQFGAGIINARALLAEPLPPR